MIRGRSEGRPLERWRQGPLRPDHPPQRPDDSLRQEQHDEHEGAADKDLPVLELLRRKSRIHRNTDEPTKGPSRLPVPPKSVMISTVPDVPQWMFSMGTNSSTIVISPPASPEKKPESRKATSRTRCVS